VALLASLGACTSLFGPDDLIYPDDARYDELCVYAVAKGTDVRAWVLEHVPQDLQERCQPVYVWVVGAADG
jgi:hypothetical protein